MSIFRADFDVKASVVLPEDSPPLSLRSYDGQSDIILRNAEKDEKGHVPRLDAIVVGPCESLDEAVYGHRETLANQLDLLAYVTQGKFEILQCRRVVDWEPFQKQREFRTMQRFDKDYPPYPDLPKACIDTANVIAAAGPSDDVRRALHYFRMGTLGRDPEDQFQEFWLALETIAGGRKQRVPLPIECPKCNGPLRCDACQAEPVRRPMALQAIREILRVMNPELAEGTFRRLNAMRNGLVHGRPIASIERDLGRTLTEVMNEAAIVAWDAIALDMPAFPEPTTLSFAHSGGQFENNQLTAGPSGQFFHEGDSEHPADEKIPNFTITMTYRFDTKPPSDRTS